MPEDGAVGVIFLVATPVGNLEDISLRALRTLKEVDLIACEDTRHTSRLLRHYEIRKPLVSCHDHNEGPRARELARRAAAGESIAVVSDAGSPGIADPGYRVVQAAIAAGVRVVPIPGPNAAISALSASGLPSSEFTFKGFLPSKSAKRRAALALIRDAVRTTVYYESPHRVLQALDDVGEILGDRDVAVARELTKRFEEILRGSAASVAEELRGRGAVKGEFVLLIGPAERGEEWPLATLEESVRSRTDRGVARAEAIERAAADRGISPEEARRHLRRAARTDGEGGSRARS